MFSTPLPLMEGGQEVRGLTYAPRHYAYVIRLTPADDEGNILYHIQDVVKEYLEENFFIYIITEELKPHQHYHIYVESDLKHDEVKQLQRNFIYSYYPVRPRGFGTKQHSCLISENPLNAIIYTLKQRGQIFYSGFTEEFIDACRKQSFEKKENDFEAELRVMTEEFLKNKNIEPMGFTADIAILYSRYDKNVCWKNINNYVNSKMIKRDPSMALSMALKHCSY